jgi:hypothetical protein
MAICSSDNSSRGTFEEKARSLLRPISRVAFPFLVDFRHDAPRCLFDRGATAGNVCVIGAGAASRKQRKADARAGEYLNCLNRPSFPQP